MLYYTILSYLYCHVVALPGRLGDEGGRRSGRRPDPPDGARHGGGA